MLFDKLKEDKVAAMKARDKEKSDTLGVVIAKAMLVRVERRAQNAELTDADVISVLQKTVKELEDEREGYVKLGRTESVESMDRQIALVKSYIPAMMSDDEIRAVIEKLDDKSIGAVMKKFKTEYAGKCEMKRVQEILKSMQ